jgi:hypothetical protein
VILTAPEYHGAVNVLRRLPWFVAFGGLAIPLVGSGFQLWELVGVWVAILAVIWLFSRPFRATWPQKIAAAVLLLPLLFAAGWEGGLWLIPADLTWLVVEVVLFVGDRARVTRSQG